MEKLLKVGEVAARLSISVRKVWAMHSSGRMPTAVRLGGAVRWKESDLEKFISNGCPACPATEGGAA